VLGPGPTSVAPMACMLRIHRNALSCSTYTPRYGLPDIACKVIGTHSHPGLSSQMAPYDVASNSQALPRGCWSSSCPRAS